MVNLKSGAGTIILDKAYEFVCMSYGNTPSGDLGRCLHPRELERIERAVEKRRAEFACGRLCAKLAYARLCGFAGFDAGLLVHNDSRGAPYFEDGRVTVGITHDEGLAAAIVTDREKLRAGLDVQRVSTEHTAVIHGFLRGNERKKFEALSGRYDPDFLAAAFWVAKESMSKLFEYGFAVLDALEVEDLGENGGLRVKFTRLHNFSVLLRPFEGYLFGFAAHDKEVGRLSEENLKIELTPEPCPPER